MKTSIIADGSDKHSLKRTAVEIMDTLPRKASSNFPPSQNDFYSFKFVSMEAAIPEVRFEGDWAQFGVYRGVLANMMLERLPQKHRLHLFDSFEGLPEDWIGTWQAGTFALDEKDIPVFPDERVKVYKGWFSDTVTHYIAENKESLAFVHVDCDLYSSTVDCLHGINDLIVPGTIILFDEYMITQAGQSDDGEHRALMGWLEMFDRKVEILWRTNWVQVAVRVLR